MSLTKRAYLLAAAILIMGIVDQWTTASLWMLWIIPGALLLTAIAAEWIVWRSKDRDHLIMDLTLGCPATTELGTDNEIDVVYENSTARAQRVQFALLWAFSIEGPVGEFELQASPDKRACTALSYTTNTLGATPLGRIHARALGLFSLAWWSTDFEPQAQTRVIPTRLRNVDVSLALNADGARKRPLPAGSGTEIRELRDYAHGDPLKNIDWKATARSGAMKTRVYEPDDRMDIVLVIDTGRSTSLRIGNLDRIGHNSNICARFAELADRCGENIGLLTYNSKPGTTLPLGRGDRHLARIRAGLGEVRSDASESNPRAAVAALSRIVSRRALVVFLTQIDEFEAAGELLNAVRLLIRKHHVVVASLQDQELIEIASRKPKGHMDPWQALASLEYQNSVRHTRLELERYGVSVVDARPEDIERSLFARYSQLKQRKAVG